jgi:RNA polymerase sigma factor (sigma-70 family)
MEEQLGQVSVDREASPSGRVSAAAPDPCLVEAVRRAQEGDEASFRAVVAELGPLVYRFLLVRLNHEGDAKDALQETLIAAWQGLPTLRRPESVRSWLLTIATRKAAQAFKARPQLIERTEWEPAAADAGELLEIRETLDRLPSSMREALLIRCLLGLSEQETADVLDVPVGTVKSRVSRARHRFRELLDEGQTSPEQKGEQDAPRY